MNLRLLVVLMRLVGPLTFAFFAASIWLLQDMTLVGLALVPFGIYCVIAGYLNWRIEHGDFLTLACPICQREGIVGRSVGGWWHSCESCGVVRPRGLLGTRVVAEKIDDYDDDTNH